MQQPVTHESQPMLLPVSLLCSPFLHHRQRTSLWGCEITGAADGSTSFVYTAVSQTVVEQAIQHWNSALKQLEQCAGKALKNLGQYWRGTVLKKEQAPHGGGVKNHLWHSAWIKLTFSRSLRWCVQKWNCCHSSCQGEKPVTHWGYRPWTQVDESWNR